MSTVAIGQVKNFYSKSTGNLDLLGTWGINADGSGTSPSNFTDSNQVFNVRNNSVPTIGTNWTVSGVNSQVVVDAGVTFATGAHTYIVGCSTIINGSFQIDQGGGAVGNNFTYGLAGTLIFNTTSGWYGVGPGDGYWPSVNGPVNVTVNGNGGNLEMQTTRTVTGVFQTGGGVRNSGTGNDLIISGTLQINANGYFTGFSPTYTNTSTLVYSTHGQYNHGNEWGGGAYVGYGVPQNVSIRNHTRLDMQAGYWALPGNLLLFGAGDTLASFPASTDIYIGGNWTRNDSATYLPLGGGIFFQGITDQTIIAPGGQTFDYIGINNYGANVVLACNVTVTTMIFFTNGHIVTGADTVILLQSGQTTVGNAYLIGNYRKYIETGATSKTFEVGDLTGYRPVTVAFGNVTTGGYLFSTVSQTSGDHPNIITSGINPSKSVNRYWTLKNEGVVFDNYSATFNYLSGDLDNGADTNKLVVRKFNSPNWAATTVGTRTGTSTQAVGLTSFSDFAIGEQQIDHYLVSATSPQTAGATFGTLVTAQDILNQTVSTDNSTVVTMTGIGNVQFDSNGDATFGDTTKALTVGTFTINTKDTISGTITITATDGNGKTGTQSGIVINTGSASKLAFGVQPGTTTAGSSITPAVTVQIQDAYGNSITGDSRNVTLAIGTNPGGGTLNGTKTIAAVSGIATFNDLSIDKTGTGYTLSATSSPALTVVNSNSFNVTPGAPAKLVFGQQPSDAIAGFSISPAVTVQVHDANDNIVTGDTRNVTLALGANPGSGTLSGTTTVAAASGIATFSDLSINKTGSGYTLSTTSTPPLPGATSDTFKITPGTLHHFVIANISSPQVVTNPFTITITAQDVNNNTVTGFKGTVNLTTNTGTIAPATSGAFSSGMRTENVLLTQAGTGRTIGVDDGSGHTATSNPFTLNKAATAGTLTTTPNPSIFGQSVTMKDSVSNGSVPDGGKVYFKVDGVIIDSASFNVNGIASISTSVLTIGNHGVTAFYGGTNNFDTSRSNTITQVVNPITTISHLVSNLNPSHYTQNVQFADTVNGGSVTPTGKVIFWDGLIRVDSATLNGSGIAIINTNGLIVGSHPMIASYAGDITHSGSVSNLVNQVVNKEPTANVFTSSVNPSSYGQAVILIDSVSGSFPDSGSVQFKDSTTTLGSPVAIDSLGRATLTIATLNTGTHSLTAVYGGTTNFESSTSPPLHQVVNRKSTFSVLSLSSNAVFIGESVTLKDSVIGAYADSGVVQFRDGDTTIGDPVDLDENNSASVTILNLSLGNHSIYAVYGGTPNFTPSTSNLVNVVVKDTSRFRTFNPDSIALARDNNGNIGRAVKRKNTRIHFTALFNNPTSGVNGLYVEFGAAIDTLLDFFTSPPSSRATLDPRLKKWQFTFAGPLNAESTVRIYGFGKTGSPQKVPKYYWTTGGVKTGSSLNNPTIGPNQPQMSMPNRINVLTETFRFNGYSQTGGLLVGNNRKTSPDSSKYYGWFLANTSTNVLNSLRDRTGLQTRYARGFDIFTASKRPLIGQQSSMPPVKENNILVADMIALKMNIVASKLGITPAGFGELIFRDTVSNLLDNMMIRDIAHYVDSMIMGYYSGGVHRFVDTSVFRKLHETVRRIDDAFEGKLDTLKFADTLRMPGTVRLGDIVFLHPNPGVIPQRMVPTVNPIADQPSTYVLYQNYPNPFNPTTTIGFELQYPSIVTIKIYNIVGQEIATLINHTNYEEGRQEVQFNGSRYSSGIYFYRIVAHPVAGADEGIPLKDFTLVKKMIMIK